MDYRFETDTQAMKCKMSPIAGLEFETEAENKSYLQDKNIRGTYLTLFYIAGCHLVSSNIYTDKEMLALKIKDIQLPDTLMLKVF